MQTELLSPSENLPSNYLLRVAGRVVTKFNLLIPGFECRSTALLGSLFVVLISVCSVAQGQNGDGSPHIAGRVVAQSVGNVMAAKEVYRYAVDLQQSGDSQRAATEFGRYLSYAKRHPDQTFPDHEKAMFHYAQSLAKNGEYDRALKAFESFGQHYPQSSQIADAMLEMGKIHEAERHSLAAQFRYGQLKKYQPDSEWEAKANLRQAWQHLQLEQDVQAIKKLEQIDQSPYQNSAKHILSELPQLKEIPQKDPKKAAILSAILPGAGHAYLDRPKDAQFAFLSNGLMIGATIEAFDQDMPALGTVLGILELGWYTGTMYSASSLAHKQNRQQRELFLENLRPYFDGKSLGVEVEF